jgi:hypothetical protein
MAEGPVVHHYAKRLRAVLEGKKVRIEFGLKKLKASEPSVSKTRILKVEAHGKQFRFHLEDQRILLIHLMMWGRWVKRVPGFKSTGRVNGPARTARLWSIFSARPGGSPMPVRNVNVNPDRIHHRDRSGMDLRGGIDI